MKTKIEINLAIVELLESITELYLKCIKDLNNKKLFQWDIKT